MTTTLDEIAPRIFRLSTCVPGIGPSGFTFNQILLDDDEPLLVHEAGGRRAPPPGLHVITSNCDPAEMLAMMADPHVGTRHHRVLARSRRKGGFGDSDSFAGVRGAVATSTNEVRTGLQGRVPGAGGA